MFVPHFFEFVITEDLSTSSRDGPSSAGKTTCTVDGELYFKAYSRVQRRTDRVVHICYSNNRITFFALPTAMNLYLFLHDMDPRGTTGLTAKGLAFLDGF